MPSEGKGLNIIGQNKIVPEPELTLALADLEYHVACNYRNESAFHKANALLLAASRHFAAVLSLRPETAPSVTEHVQKMAECHIFLGQDRRNPKARSHLLKAVEILERACQQEASHPRQYRLLGNAYFALGQQETDPYFLFRALDALEKAHSRGRSGPSIMFKLARTNFLIGASLVYKENQRAKVYLQQSIDWYEKSRQCLRLTPKNPEEYPGRLAQAHHHLWRVTKNLTDLENAIANYETAVQADQRKIEEGNRPRYLSGLINALYEHYSYFYAREAKPDPRLLERARHLSDKIHNQIRPGHEHFANHCKQRGKIYHALGCHRKDTRLLDEAERCFRQPALRADREIGRLLGNTVGNRALITAKIDDYERAIEYLANSADLSDHIGSAIGLLPKLQMYAARLLTSERPHDAESYVNRAIRLLSTYIGNRSASARNRDIHRVFSSLLARAYAIRYGVLHNVVDLKRATRLFETLAKEDRASGVDYGMLASVTYQYAKLTMTAEDKLSAFKDAAAYYEKAQAEPGFERYLSSNRAELLLRLCQMEPSVELAQRAVEMYEESIRYGNKTAEGFGLAGDAHFQFARLLFSERRSTSAIRHFRRALELKREAKKLGGRTKENFSICGNIHQFLYTALRRQHSGASRHLRSAIDNTLFAHEFDRTWAWPYCQLAVILEKYPEESATVLRSAEKRKGVVAAGGPLLELSRDGSANELWKKAAQLAYFEAKARKPIGSVKGANKPFVVDDEHGLLEFVFVFKPAKGHNKYQHLREELEHATAFHKYLREIGYSIVAIPEPITVDVYEQSSPLLVMRRLKGPTLAGLLVTEHHCKVLPIIESVIRLLALYHAWQPPRPARKWERRSQWIMETLGRRRNKKTVGPTIRALTSCLRHMMGAVPETLSRDAHPENWLVLPDGRVGMIDFGRSRYGMFFHDLVQLLEDLPFLELNEKGWNSRLQLADMYLQEYVERTGSKGSTCLAAVNNVGIEKLYLCLLLLRTCFGISWTMGKVPHASSNMRMRLKDRRRRHMDILRLLPNWWRATIGVGTAREKDLFDAVQKLSDDLRNM
ncbi:MAG: aminoglycoside phosphotransferase family protein [Candidatus Bathyarchaeota archaeon]|nr:aminoglycoside phosphotransferase family protein [Candidatus Bathyarchaeota archaeon]